uniref:Uncharacterized protein n=1 Tax=Rhizophora mucronata TaxID=61149 RepID=A0A2P2JT63_RHIMU
MSDIVYTFLTEVGGMVVSSNMLELYLEVGRENSSIVILCDFSPTTYNHFVP